MDSWLPNYARLAVCSLNQWAQDFSGNYERIRRSILQAKALGAKYRVGSELEVSGYSSEDHYFEADTVYHAWEVISLLLRNNLTDGIICDIGAPVLFDGVRPRRSFLRVLKAVYNCRVLLLDGRVLLVRPKCRLADEHMYREARFFVRWSFTAELKTIKLPSVVTQVNNQTEAPFGVAMLSCRGVLIGFETCEELWVHGAIHEALFLRGALIVTNASGSYFEVGKHQRRKALLEAATRKYGGVYVYSNQTGCDGSRVVFDGGILVYRNGTAVAAGERFVLSQMQMLVVSVDLHEVQSYRLSKPAYLRAVAAASKDLQRVPIIYTNFSLAPDGRFAVRIQQDIHHAQKPTPTAEQLNLAKKSIAPDLTREEEIAMGASLWLWDFLRRSRASGFFVALSGGADSAAVLTLLVFMCHRVMKQLALQRMQCLREVENVHAGAAPDCPVYTYEGDSSLLRSLELLLQLPRDHKDFPTTGRALVERVVSCCYMQSSQSSALTRAMSRRLAEDTGAFFLAASIDGIVSASLQALRAVTGETLRFQANGGTLEEDLALQNLQARTRLVFSYLLAQTLPLYRRRVSLAADIHELEDRHAQVLAASEDSRSRGIPTLANRATKDDRAGFLLVVGTGNADEALRGYLTKFDCSSGDLSPIGGLCKDDVRSLLRWFARSDVLNLPVLLEVLELRPSAELRPPSIVSRVGDDGQVEETAVPQDDEAEMGLTYEQLGLLGKWRIADRCGPVSLFKKALFSADANHAFSGTPIETCE